LRYAAYRLQPQRRLFSQCEYGIELDLGLYSINGLRYLGVKARTCAEKSCGDSRSRTRSTSPLNDCFLRVPTPNELEVVRLCPWSVSTTVPDRDGRSQ